MGHRRNARSTSLAAGVLVGVLAALTGAVGGHAAPPFATEATITSLDFVQSTVESGEHAELTGRWSLPDNPTTPAGFVINLPAGLAGDADAFALVANDGVTEVGRCTVTATQLVCDLDAQYIAANPRNLTGTFNFWTIVTTEVTERREVVFDFGDVSAGITVTPAASTCPPTCEFDGIVNYKGGTYDATRGTIDWVVGIKAPPTGMAGGETVTVIDTPGPGQEILPGATVRHANAVGIGLTGEPGPVGWRPKPADTYTVSPDGSTVTFVSEPGYFYKVQYSTRVVDGGAARTYTNDAEVTIEGQRTVVVTGEVVRRGGGGTGGGEPVGRFSVTKDVVWHTEPVDIAFTGTFTVTDPEGTIHSGGFEVSDGTTWTSEAFPAGSIVHLEEILPSRPSSIRWADPVFSANDFEIPNGTVTAVDLRNEASVATGVFAASKRLTGSGAELVPSDATFVLEYAYPAGPGYPAGGGTLTLPADGTAVTSPPLPVGAAVTLAERSPDPVAGATWGGPRLSTETLVVSTDADVTVTVTNPITEVPAITPPPTPTTPTALALTGGDLAFVPVAGAGLILIAVGALSQVRRRRRATAP